MASRPLLSASAPQRDKIITIRWLARMNFPDDPEFRQDEEPGFRGCGCAENVTRRSRKSRSTGSACRRLQTSRPEAVEPAAGPPQFRTPNSRNSLALVIVPIEAVISPHRPSFASTHASPTTANAADNGSVPDPRMPEAGISCVPEQHART